MSSQIVARLDETLFIKEVSIYQLFRESLGRVSLIPWRHTFEAPQLAICSLLWDRCNECVQSRHFFPQSKSVSSALYCEGVCYCVMNHNFDSELCRTEGEARPAI